MKNSCLNILLTVILAFMVSVAAHAQVGELRNDFAVGFNGGCTMDKISFDPTINQTWKVGSTFGMTARYTCEKYFGIICALQAELNYAQMGWKENIEESTDTYQRTIHYFQIPMLAHLGFGKEYNGVAGFIVLGPQIGLALGETEKKGGEWSAATLSTRPNNVVEQYDLKVQNKFDYGITGGAGIEITKPRFGHMSIEGRYYFGLRDIFENGKADAFGRSAHGAIVAKITYLIDATNIKKHRQSKKQQKR